MRGYSFILILVILALISGAKCTSAAAEDEGPVSLLEFDFSVVPGFGPSNANSCASCHNFPVVGGSAAPGDQSATANYMGWIQDYDPERELEARIATAFFFHYGDTNEPLRGYPMSKRIVRPLFAAGDIALVNLDHVLALQDPDDLDGDGITGVIQDHRRRRYFGSQSRNRFFYFIQNGIEAEFGLTIDEINAAIASGILPPDGIDCQITNAQDMTRCLQAEIRALDPPSMVPPGLSDPIPAVATVLDRGRELMDDFNCTGCHVERVTGKRLFSDFLMHDMGPELDDGVAHPNLGAASSEWMTTPLRFLSEPFLHDGRADTLHFAIWWHGGEAQASRQAYLDAPIEDRVALLLFLETLRD